MSTEETMENLKKREELKDTESIDDFYEEFCKLVPDGSSYTTSMLVIYQNYTDRCGYINSKRFFNYLAVKYGAKYHDRQANLAVFSSDYGTIRNTRTVLHETILRY
jgi:hypothetical protein